VAKRKTQTLSVPESVELSVPESVELSVPESVELSVPVAEAPAPDYLLHVEARLTRSQGAAMRRLVAGLERGGARADRPGRSDRRVDGYADAIRWLLDEIARR